MGNFGDMLKGGPFECSTCPFVKNLNVTDLLRPFKKRFVLDIFIKYLLTALRLSLSFIKFVQKIYSRVREGSLVSVVLWKVAQFRQFSVRLNQQPTPYILFSS